MSESGEEEASREGEGRISSKRDERWRIGRSCDPLASLSGTRSLLILRRLNNHISVGMQVTLSSHQDDTISVLCGALFGMRATTATAGSADATLAS